MRREETPKLKYLMSTFIPLKQIVVVTRMFVDGTGKTDILKATEEGTPVRGEDAVNIVQHSSMHDIEDLKRTHGKAVLNYFSPDFFGKMKRKRAKKKGKVFFRLQILIKEYGLFFSVTKRYDKNYAMARFFTEEFTLGRTDAEVTDVTRLKAESYSEIVKESLKLLHIITTTISSVERKILPIKEAIVKETKEDMNKTLDEFKMKMERMVEEIKEKMIREFMSTEMS